MVRCRANKVTRYYGTPSLSYNAVYALYGMVISIYDVVTSIYCVVISIGLAKISVPSMLHFDEKIKFQEICSK